MVGNLLLRGMIAGAIAGLLAFGFARVVGEPPVAHAIALEEAAGEPQAMDLGNATAQAAPQAEEEELVSRATQAGIGLFTGVVVFGAALGGLFALTFAFSYGRLGTLSPRATAAVLAVLGFIALGLVPDLKYPPNPPAVGSGETIGLRTELFFIMLALSLLSMVLAVVLARRLTPALGAWNGALLGGLLYLVIVVVAHQALPAIDEVGEGFPASLLWDFRLASLGTRTILWAGLGLIFGYVAERYLASSSPQGRIAPAYAGR